MGRLCPVCRCGMLNNMDECDNYNCDLWRPRPGPPSPPKNDD